MSAPLWRTTAWMGTLAPRLDPTVFTAGDIAWAGADHAKMADTLSHTLVDRAGDSLAARPSNVSLSSSSSTRNVLALGAHCARKNHAICARSALPCTSPDLPLGSAHPPRC